MIIHLNNQSLDLCRYNVFADMTIKVANIFANQPCANSYGISIYSYTINILDMNLVALIDLSNYDNEISIQDDGIINTCLNNSLRY